MSVKRTKYGTSNWTRRALLAGLAASVASPALANPPETSLRPRMRGVGLAKARVAGPETLVDAAGLSGRVSYAVADARTGLLLEGRNATTGTLPASVAKALTALYALDVLGAEHRFITRVLATGGVSDGVVQGDLVLSGGCDPTLDTNALAELAAALKGAGIRGVTGEFIVDDTALPSIDTIDPDQPDHVGYSPAISGIALNYNRVHFEWRRGSSGYAVTMDARSDRYRPDVTMARMRIEDRAAPVYTYADRAGRDEWSVARGALGKGGARWLPVRKPGLYAGEVFATLARAHGIVLKPPRLAAAPVTGRELANVRSVPLRGMLRDMLRYSTNLTAEMVGLAASRKRIGPVASLAQSAAEMNSWARGALGLGSPALADHSGLGEASRLSADDMVRALVAAHAEARLRPILKSVAMRDSKGRPRKDHPLEVVAKTGTLNFVSGLAGYVTATDGTELAFAIFAADTDARSKIARADREAPRGARPWNARAKRLQQQLLERWGVLYGT